MKKRPFALRLLAHRKIRTAVAISGIAFAVLFMFLQLGFSGALNETATAVSSKLRGDLVVTSVKFLHLGQTGSIPRSRLFQARALPEVMTAVPLYVRFARWIGPSSGRRCSMFAIGFPMGGTAPVSFTGLAELLPALSAPGSIAADLVSQQKCGVTSELRSVEVREQARRVIGAYSLGVGFLGDGSLVTSDETYGQIFQSQSLDNIDIGMITLREGSDLQAVAARLRQVLPPDTLVMTRSELDGRQVRYWVEDTAIGNIFRLGTIVGFLVGMMILFQVLSTDIRAQLPQYATMKAMGFANQHIYALVLQQSWLFALLGYLPATLLAMVVYAAAYDATLIPIAMTRTRAISVLILSLVMCTISGALSLSRIGRADPAELF